MNYESQILGYIRENFLFGDGQDIQLTQSLLGSGIIDSTGILELVTFIEETFGLQVADAEMVPSNLDSISQISDFIRRKQGGAPAVEADSGRAERADQRVSP